MKDLMAQLIDENKSGLARELARMNLTFKFLYSMVLENRFIKSFKFFIFKS